MLNFRPQIHMQYHSNADLSESPIQDQYYSSFMYEQHLRRTKQIQLSTRIKDAGIAIRHSRGYIVSILQGPERGWRSRVRERIWRPCSSRLLVQPPGRPKSRDPGEASWPRRPHAEPSSAGSPDSWDFGLPGGCASSRLDHGFQIPSKTTKS